MNKVKKKPKIYIQFTFITMCMNQMVIDFSLVKIEKNISYNLSKINYIAIGIGKISLYSYRYSYYWRKAPKHYSLVLTVIVIIDMTYCNYMDFMINLSDM